MPIRLRLYIGSIIALAVLTVMAVVELGPPATLRSAATAGFLCAIGWLAGLLTYELDQKGARASVGFLMFPAAAFAVANWTVPIAVCLTVLALEVRRKAETRKALFNTGALVLSNAVAILAFHATGGSAWIENGNVPFVAIATLLLASNLTGRAATAGVIALSSGQPFWRTWRAVTGRTVVDDVLVSPFAVVIAYAVAVWGILSTIVVC